jgi:hypothetical protein
VEKGAVKVHLEFIPVMIMENPVQMIRTCTYYCMNKDICSFLFCFEIYVAGNRSEDPSHSLIPKTKKKNQTYISSSSSSFLF